MMPAPIPEHDSERVASLRRMLLLSTPDEAAFDRVTRVARRLFDVPIALISLVDAQRQWFKSCVGLPVRQMGRDISFCGHAIMSDQLFVVEDARSDARFADNPLVTGQARVVFYAGRPLCNAEGQRVGTLCLIDDAPRRFGAGERQLLDDLGYWVEAVFASRELGGAQREMLIEFDEVRRDSLLDPMLNIWNRGGAMQLLERECQWADRQGLQLSLLMIDVDHFKDVNDLHGHQVGDALLCEFVHRLRATLRATDHLGRYGGDEFMAILPDTGTDAAQAVAGRLLGALAAEPLRCADLDLSMAASIGFATRELGDDRDCAALIACADRGLLAAKRTGRGRVQEGNAVV